MRVFRKLSTSLSYRLSDNSFHGVISRRRMTNTPSSFWPCEINYLKVYIKINEKIDSKNVKNSQLRLLFIPAKAGIQ
jgi:hypothetical protein